MKVLVAIPSYNRPYTIEKRTGFWVKKLKDIDYKVFVRSDQYLYYNQVFDSKHLVEINVNSYRETINAIRDYAMVNGYDLIHKFDDDMSFKRLGMAKKSDAHHVYKQLYADVVNCFMQDPDLYGVSVAKPMNHIRNKDTQFTRHNKCLYGNMWLRPEIMYMPKGIELLDDVWNTLNILKIGKKTASYTLAYEDAELLKNDGGLQSIDRNKATRNTIEVMATYFDNVRVGSYKGNSKILDVDLKHLGIK